MLWRNAASDPSADRRGTPQPGRRGHVGLALDAHDGKTYRDPVTVRELAEEHLDIPGVRGVPCQRRLMLELQAAVEGRDGPPPDAGQNERVYLIEEVVKALSLREDGAVYHGPEGCEIDFIYGSRSELEPTLRDGPAGNHGW